MDDRRRATRAAYGGDYLHNLRWGYHRRYGTGSEEDPVRAGGSFGRGYQRAADIGARELSAPVRGRVGRGGYDREFRHDERRHGSGEDPYRGEGGGRWGGRGARRPGTAARDYDRAFPYFGSAAALEGAQGYPPGDSLVPETYPHVRRHRRRRR